MSHFLTFDYCLFDLFILEEYIIIDQIINFIIKYMVDLLIVKKAYYIVVIIGNC